MPDINSRELSKSAPAEQADSKFTQEQAGRYQTVEKPLPGSASEQAPSSVSNRYFTPVEPVLAPDPADKIDWDDWETRSRSASEPAAGRQIDPDILQPARERAVSAPADVPNRYQPAMEAAADQSQSAAANLSEPVQLAADAPARAADSPALGEPGPDRGRENPTPTMEELLKEEIGRLDAKEKALDIYREQGEPASNNMNFEDVMTDPRGRELLRQQGVKAFNAENMGFLDAVENYKKSLPDLNNAEARQAAKNIQEKYIGSAAPEQVNISSRDTAKIAEFAREGDTRPPDDLFDGAENTVAKHIKENGFANAFKNEDGEFRAYAANRRQELGEQRVAFEKQNNILKQELARGTIAQEIEALEKQTSELEGKKDKPVGLEDYLSDPKGHAVLERYVAKDQSKENILFLDDVDKYKREAANQTDVERLRAAKDLSARFEDQAVKVGETEGANYSVNLPGPLKVAVQQKIREAGNDPGSLDKDIFKDVEQDIKNLVKQDTLPRARNTPEFVAFEDNKREQWAKQIDANQKQIDHLKKEQAEGRAIEAAERLQNEAAQKLATELKEALSRDTVNQQIKALEKQKSELETKSQGAVTVETYMSDEKGRKLIKDMTEKEFSKENYTFLNDIDRYEKEAVHQSDSERLEAAKDLGGYFKISTNEVRLNGEGKTDMNFSGALNASVQQKIADAEQNPGNLDKDREIFSEAKEQIQKLVATDTLKRARGQNPDVRAFEANKKEEWAKEIDAKQQQIDFLKQEQEEGRAIEAAEKLQLEAAEQQAREASQQLEIKAAMEHRIAIERANELKRNGQKFETRNPSTALYAIPDPLKPGGELFVSAGVYGDKAKLTPMELSAVKDKVNRGTQLTQDVLSGKQVGPSTAQQLSDMSYAMQVRAQNQTRLDYKSGAVSVEDKDGRLKAFIDSNPNAYSRTSSHVEAFQSRTNLGRGVDLRGEASGDMTQSLPGSARTMLVHSMGTGGPAGMPTNRVLIKFESHGAPYSLNPPLGKAHRRTGVMVPINRNHRMDKNFREDAKESLGHGMSFLKGGAGKNPLHDRREKMEAAKDDFKNLVETPSRTQRFKNWLRPPTAPKTTLDPAVRDILKQGDPMKSGHGARVLHKNIEAAKKKLEAMERAEAPASDRRAELIEQRVELNKFSEKHLKGDNMDCRISNEVILNAGDLGA